MDQVDDAAMKILMANRPPSKPSGQNARSAASVYTPLNRQRKEIRLLSVQASIEALAGFPLGLISQPVCTLQVVSLLDDPVYDCVSYRWGSSQELLDITVNGVEMQVTVNLNDALRQFRCDAQEAGDPPVRLWADAICINQEDVEEKNGQVAMMREIYSQAATVRIWLAAASAWTDGDVGYGFNLVDRIGTQGKSVPEIVKKFLVKPVLGLGTLFGNPYWRRRWITQEIALAKTLTMHFGPVKRSLNVETELENLKMFCLQMNYRYMKVTQRGTGLFPLTTPDQPTWQEWLAMYQATTAIHSVLHPICTAKSLIKKERPDETVHLVRGAEANVKHDHVYALLGMIPAEPTLVPDYTKPWYDAWADFTHIAMQSMHNLSMLYYASSGLPDLPSWTPDWSTEVDAANNPVGLQADYSADAGTSFSLSMPQPGAIRTRGIIVDAVRVLGATTSADLARIPALEEVLAAGMARDRNGILQNWLALYSAYQNPKRRSGEAAKEINEAMLRTLVADYGNRLGVEVNGQPVTIPRRLTSQEVRRSTREINWDLKGSTPTHDIYNEVMHRMRKYSFFMTADGRPGMAKQSVREGDKICIFSSCKVPYCIRSAEKDGHVVYSVVSSCYVDGIMDGEAILNAYAIAETVRQRDVTEDDIFQDVTLI